MLNRLGQSIPPILVSDSVRRLPLKKRLLTLSVFLMGASFLVLATTWYCLDGQHPGWLPILFLTVYGFFFFCVGVHNLSQSLLYGKLVTVTTRGRLMLISTCLGSVAAITCAWFLMRGWLSQGSRSFFWMFLFTGSAFWIATFVSVWLSESRDESNGDRQNLGQTIQGIKKVMAQNANFRRLAFIVACYGFSITLFPHYQAYVRQNLSLGLESFVPWVIAQNIGAAAFSVPLGSIADRFGNRLAMNLTMLMLCIAPALSMVWLHFGDGSQSGFYMVFFLLGLTPVAMRTFSNYTLEIADANQQPIYLSTLGACMAVPVVTLSALVGWAIDQFGFEPMFLTVIAMLIVGWSLTFRLDEPRSNDPNKPTSPLQSATIN